MILEIKVGKIINNSKGYGRMASPVFHTWQWKQAVKSKDRTPLKYFAETMPLEIFYCRKREYRIVEDE